MERFDAAEFVAAVRDFGVSTCSLAPTMMDLLLEHLQRDPDGLAVVRERLRVHRLRLGADAAVADPAHHRRAWAAS